MHLRNIVLASLAITASAFCQSKLDTTYQIGYAAHLSSGIESVVNVINAGGNGGVPQYGPSFGTPYGGNMCINIYAFDPDEELIACCSCLITPGQVIGLRVASDILAKTPTPVPDSVTIKLIGSTGPLPVSGQGGPSNCTNSAARVNDPPPPVPLPDQPVGGYVAFRSTVHPGAAGAFVMTETPFIPATLSPSELTSITTRCAVILANNSGYGVCSATVCANGALGAAKE